MPFKIINKQILANNVKRLDILAPNIAKKVQPGQFVSVCPEEDDERIPLTVVESDAQRGTIALIFQEKGQTTNKLASIAINEFIFSVLGPLGVPAKISNAGTVVCVATGIGTAQILPIIRAFRKAGSKVISIIGASSKRELLLEAQIRLNCQQIIVATDDGSYQRKGMATDLLKETLAKQNVNLVYAIGSIEMMRQISTMTQEKNIRFLVQLNPMMVDCMGMCGSCRVKVAGKVVLACTEGPEFDGHEVDFKDYEIRVNAFKENPQWHNQKSQPNPARNESRIFKRLVSGLLKE